MSKTELTKEQMLAVQEQIEQAVAKARKEDELRLKQFKKNLVEIGAEVKTTECIPGKPIIDKDTKQQRVDNNGIPQTYPDKYKASITFNGGSLDIDIDKANFDTLQPLETYLFKGHYGSVKRFGNEVNEPIFTSIIKL